MSFSNICFLINKLDIFIIKNFNTHLAQYIISRQKQITRLLIKDIFKVTICQDTPKNTWILTFCFINKIKNPDIDKTYQNI